MNTEQTCQLCGAAIAATEQWEYASGSYAPSTPEAAKGRVHNRCVQHQLREVLALLRQVPEDARADLYLEL